jgi:hypothetical protein
VKNVDKDWLVILIAVLTSFAASSGFWAYLASRRQGNNATTRLLMGLAHDKITSNGLHFIQRGYITNDEFEDLRKYLYEPYLELGGNGSVERIMQEISKLPLVVPESTYTPSKESHVQLHIPRSSHAAS